MNLVDSSCFRHVFLRWNVGDLGAGKEPRQEIHGCDSHANAEQHTGKHTLRAAFPKGESEAGYNNGDERETASDGAGEGRLEHAYRVFPRRSSRLGEGWSREKKCETDDEKRQRHPSGAQILAKKPLHVWILLVCFDF